jgi:hypothetical protein
LLPKLAPLCAFFVSSLAGQTTPAAAPLKIVVLQGANAVNNVKTRVVTEPVVEIRDARDLPVAGADVVFQLPAAGPGGTFPDSSLTYTTRSNARGQAAAAPFVPNHEVGRFYIKVTATSNGQTASLAIAQQNALEMIAPARRGLSRRWKILIAVGAAAAGGAAFAATRIGGDSKPVNSVSITSGIITVGGPR